MENQNTIQTPVLTPVIEPTLPISPKPFSKLIIFIFFFMIILFVGLGAYILGTKSKAPPIVQPTPLAVTRPTPTPDQNQAGKNITWETKTIPIQIENAQMGKRTINMELKVPNGWTWEEHPYLPSSSSLIKNCSSYKIINPAGNSYLVLDLICEGWSAKYSSWPTDSVIALQQRRSGNDGPHNYYRVRYATTTYIYDYADAMTDPNFPLDKSKDLMDAILIGYAPPKESTDDFFFIPAHLIATFSGVVGEKDNYLSIVDQITASITLR